MSRVSCKALSFALMAGPVWAADLPFEEPVFPEVDSAQVELGRLLFYDPILSGSKTVSCATCHHPKFATGDGVSLGLGDGAKGLGPDRVADTDNLPEQRIPRNAPPLFNLGATEFTVFFHDGRLEEDASRPSGIRTPLGSEMEMGFASALSAQSMFPVLSADEMAGHYSENEISQAVRQGLITGPGGAWDLLSQRIEAIPEYRARFDDVIGKEPIHFTDISDAVAAFLDFEWRGVASPFDLYLRNGTEMEPAAMRGMDLFYGKAQCADCHSGRFQTDHGFHAIAMPQIGPGKAARFESHAQDTGRMRVTGDPEDAYAFRTPPLRNVVKTAPYGHSGAYATLEGAVRHHLDPVERLRSYGISQAVMPGFDANDMRVLSDATEVDRIAAANDLAPILLTDGEVDDILAFLNALTDPQSVRGALGVPSAVPSGLLVDR
ncbi:cytochrome c peroxidase [uncultured Tateyamaria sp.]|uniref:cytochrome-c peroxidase n=1 Tax=uncultured Tateyamaria sp. TaxID=455651 RepID=UPI00263930F3|nr:cytochrome c peroxidase [uncultured Tateyamaria sp.]